MSQYAALRFLPATFGLLQHQAPAVFEFCFPDWVAQRCPLPSVDLKLLPGGNKIQVDWPVAAVTIILGMFLGFNTGLDLLQRSMSNKKKPPQNTRPGLFVWALALLWYALMCVGGLFFHCLRVEPVFHFMDVVATCSSSISILAGFAALRGHFDDRRALQRLGLLLTFLVISAMALFGPLLLQEQLYLLPIFATSFAGFFITKFCLQAAWTPGPQSKGFRRASMWLILALVGFVLGLCSLFTDGRLCVNFGVHFSLLFWAFTGSNLSMWCLYRFVLVVHNENLNLSNHIKRES